MSVNPEGVEVPFDPGVETEQSESGLFSPSLAPYSKPPPPRDRSGEHVFYNSAVASRSICGRVHYCISCPGWNKATSMRTVYSRWEFSECCCCTVPTGRQMDAFDADIIVDISAHQNLFQICRGEGDIVLWRLAGGDLSHGGELTMSGLYTVNLSLHLCFC